MYQVYQGKGIPVSVWKRQRHETEYSLNKHRPVSLVKKGICTSFLYNGIQEDSQNAADEAKVSNSTARKGKLKLEAGVSQALESEAG